MEVLLCWLVGILFAISIYLLLSQNLMRVLYGIMLISSSINLLIFVVGRLTRYVPAFIPDGKTVAPKVFANALPQALILTAIVIGFGVVAYTLVLITKAWQEIGCMSANEMRIAEPKEHDNA